MNEEKKSAEKMGPIIWAVGGGKGGVGKSVISTLIGFWLSQMGQKTVLIDVDFGGANLHTMLGIKSPPRTVNDYVAKKYNRLEDICIETDIENLRLLSGASEILSLANLQFAQKLKIMQSVSQLETDYAILDLGSGTSYNVLDFFLMAHRKIVVLTPQPISIQNAYAFVRNAVYRKLSRLSSQKPALLATIKTAMDPKNELNVRTMKDLLRAVQENNSEEDMNLLSREIADIRPALVTNMTKSQRDQDAGRIIQLVSEKYLMIHPTILGSIMRDNQIDNMISGMVPLTAIDRASDAFAGVYNIVTDLLK